MVGCCWHMRKDLCLCEDYLWMSSLVRTVKKSISSCLSTCLFDLLDFLAVFIYIYMLVQ